MVTSTTSRPPDTADPALTDPHFRTAVALAMTLGLAGASWVVVVQHMVGMGSSHMGTSSAGFGSVASFLAWWVPMMAAMMLPGATPAVVRHARASGRVRTVPLFLAAYLAVWALVGAAGFAVAMVYQPDGPFAAGAIVLVAGGYQLSPVARYFRRRCDASVRSGFAYGFNCVGSTLGLMSLLALDPMSVLLMVVVTVLVLAQKLLPARLWKNGKETRRKS